MCPPRVPRCGLLVVLLTALPLAAAPPRSPVAGYIEHKVTRGETLWAISQKHQTSVGAIMDYNHLPDHNVREGMTLRIPRRIAEDPRRQRQIVHIVKQGETFWTIARNYKISPELLAKANPNVNPNRVHEDMELLIPVSEEVEAAPPSDDPKPAPGSMIQHTVGDDETFYSIGRRYGVPMETVVAANPTVTPERLRAGMKVWVPSKNTTPGKTGSSSPKTSTPAAPARGRTHTVAEGESTTTIAKQHGVSEAALLRENKLSDDDVIYVGDVLKIPGGSASPAKPSTPKPLASDTKNPPPTKPDKPTPPNTVGQDGTIRSYIVSAGENESTICDAFGISKQQLYDYNRLAPGTKLKPGDEIAIPRVAKSRQR